MKESNLWLAYARDDLETIRQLSNSNLYRIICYHAQQVAEKSLKAFLSHEGKDIPRIHDVAYLYGLTGLELKIDPADLEFLSSIYLESRYPPDIGLLPGGEPNENDAERAAAVAEALFSQIEEAISKD